MSSILGMDLGIDVPTIDLGIDMPSMDDLGLSDLLNMPNDLLKSIDSQLGLSTSLEDLKKSLGGLGDDIQKGVDHISTQVSDGAEHYSNQVTDGVEHLSQEVSNLPQNAANMVGSTISSLFSGVFGGIGITGWAIIGVGTFVVGKYVVYPILSNEKVQKAGLAYATGGTSLLAEKGGKDGSGN